MKMYFARPENIAGTTQEKLLMLHIMSEPRFRSHKLVYPDLPRTTHGYFSKEEHVRLIGLACACDVFIFLPFGDGKIHYRHGEKLKILRRRIISLYEIHAQGKIVSVQSDMLHDRMLSKSDTSSRIWSVFGYMRSYV